MKKTKTAKEERWREFIAKIMAEISNGIKSFSFPSFGSQWRALCDIHSPWHLTERETESNDEHCSAAFEVPRINLHFESKFIKPKSTSWSSSETAAASESSKPLNMLFKSETKKSTRNRDGDHKKSQQFWSIVYRSTRVCTAIDKHKIVREIERFFLSLAPSHSCVS